MALAIDLRPSSGGVRRIQGAIVGDESYFDSLRGGPDTHYRPNIETEGSLSALAYDAGFTEPARGRAGCRPAAGRDPGLRRGARRAPGSVSRRAPVSRPASHRTRPRCLTSEQLAHAGEADAADQQPVGQLLRRDVAQGPRRALRRRRQHRPWRCRRAQRDRTGTSACTTARRRLRSVALRPHQPRQIVLLLREMQGQPRVLELTGDRGRARHDDGRDAPYARRSTTAAARPARCTMSPTSSATAAPPTATASFSRS